MVGQRRGEPGSNARWGRSRGRRLAVLLLAGLALGVAACDAPIRVTGFGTTGGTSGRGGNGSGAGAGALVGSWRSLSQLVISPDERVIFDVRWVFDAGGGCSRTRIQTVIAGNSGDETTETILCTYTVSGSTVAVTFQGSSVPSRFSFAFSGGDLLLSGVRFSRFA